MPYIRIGRSHTNVGHNLWDILKQLPNKGVGRYVIRNRLFSQFPEPSLVKIKDVQTTFNEVSTALTGRLIVEDWFRGRHTPERELKFGVTHTDWALVPRDEEQRYIQAVLDYKPPKKKVLPNTIKLPPLLKLHLEQRQNLSLDRIPLQVSLDNAWFTRHAEEGEDHTVGLDEVDGLGSTDKGHLYEGVDLTNSTHPPTEVYNEPGKSNWNAVEFGNAEQEILGVPKDGQRPYLDIISYYYKHPIK